MADERKPPPTLPYGPMLFHAGLAAGAFFSLNRFVLDQPFATSLLWAVVAAPFAAYLAYSQSRR